MKKGELMKKTKYLHGDERVKVSAWEPKWIDMILGGSNISFYFTEEEAADERRLYAISILLQAVISTLNKKEPRAQLIAIFCLYCEVFKIHTPVPFYAQRP
jgi:hypothetical protein